MLETVIGYIGIFLFGVLVGISIFVAYSNPSR